MLDPRSFKPQASGLVNGGRVRVDHDCGPGRTLLITREGGISAFCFRCNDRGWLPPEPEPLSVRLTRLSKAKVQDTAAAAASVALPAPVVRAWADWPAPCRLWLLKAGLSSDDLPKLGAYYHPPTDRVVLPVLGPSGGPLFWQARAVDGRQPKYLAPSVDKTQVVAKYGRAADVTLTEDILSAYKVGLVGEGWSLLGTSISKLYVAELLARKCTVNVWLDPDPPGQRAARKVLATLRGVGLKARNILSSRDPKLLHKPDILKLLTRGL